MPPETIEDWMKRIGSREAMERRQDERLSGKLNKPLRRDAPPGQWWTSHKIDCLCERCFPPELEDVRRMMIRARDGNLPNGEWKEPVASKPAKKKRKRPKNGFPQPRKKWSQQRGNSGN